MSREKGGNAMTRLFEKQPIDDKYLSPDVDVFGLVSDGVALAMTIVRITGHRNPNKVYENDLAFDGDPNLIQALQFLRRYADWHKIDMPEAYKRAIAVMNNPAIQRLLAQHGELGEDLGNHHLYGSPAHPMSTTWARIPDAVFMQSTKAETGYHTIIAVSEPLTNEDINRYELIRLEVK